MKKNDTSTIAEKPIQKLTKEESKLVALESKRDEIENAIKESKAEIARLREQIKQEKLAAIAQLMEGKNISVDDLLNAAFSGDMLTIQEKMEENSSAEAVTNDTEDTAE